MFCFSARIEWVWELRCLSVIAPSPIHSVSGGLIFSHNCSPQDGTGTMNFLSVHHEHGQLGLCRRLVDWCSRAAASCYMVLFFRDMHYLGFFLCSCDEIVVTAVAGIIAGTFITSCSFIISLCPPMVLPFSSALYIYLLICWCTNQWTFLHCLVKMHLLVRY